MISGTVVANRGPIVPLVVCDADSRQHVFSAIVDSGFTGWLTLPKETISELGLSWRTYGSGILADGSEMLCKVYDANIVLDGMPKAILVAETGSIPLIGMRLLYGFRILIENVDGGSVQIEQLEPT